MTVHTHTVSMKETQCLLPEVGAILWEPRASLATLERARDQVASSPGSAVPGEGIHDL